MNTRKNAKYARLPRLNRETRELLEIIRLDVGRYDALNRMMHEAHQPSAIGSGYNVDIDLLVIDLVPYLMTAYLPAATGELTTFQHRMLVAAQERIQWRNLAEHLRYYIHQPARSWYADQTTTGWEVAVYQDLGLC